MIFCLIRKRQILERLKKIEESLKQRMKINCQVKSLLGDYVLGLLFGDVACFLGVKTLKPVTQHSGEYFRLVMCNVMPTVCQFSILNLLDLLSNSNSFPSDDNILNYSKTYLELSILESLIFNKTELIFNPEPNRGLVRDKISLSNDVPVLDGQVVLHIL